MFERFTDRARRVVVLAQEEARLLDHNYIGTEHILLGLIHEGDGVAAQALVASGVSLEAVRTKVQEIIGRGGAAPSGHIPFTPRAKKTLELSLREALQLGHNYIGTEHILLGLLRLNEGVAYEVLTTFGLEIGTVRTNVIQLLSAYGGRPQPEGMLHTEADWVELELARCSFCRQPAEMAGPLARSKSAMICRNCAEAAIAIIDEGDDGPEEYGGPDQVVGPDAG